MEKGEVNNQIVLTIHEADALFIFSEIILRLPEDQVHYLIREELVLTKLLLDVDMNDYSCKHQTDNVDE